MTESEVLLSASISALTYIGCDCSDSLRIYMIFVCQLLSFSRESSSDMIVIYDTVLVDILPVVNRIIANESS